MANIVIVDCAKNKKVIKKPKNSKYDHVCVCGIYCCKTRAFMSKEETYFLLTIYCLHLLYCEEMKLSVMDSFEDPLNAKVNKCMSETEVGQ